MPSVVRLYLDSGDNEQILQVVVIAEAAVLQHNLFQQLNELALEASQHEGLHGDRHLLRVARLWQSCGVDLHTGTHILLSLQTNCST